MIRIISIFIYINLLFAYCVTFEVNIADADTPDGNFILLMNGSWNEWGWGQELTETGTEGIYSGELCGLENGDYQYVHVITGNFDSWSGWGMIGNPPLGSSCDFLPNDSYQNYGFTINNSNASTNLNSWNCCGTNNCSDWEGCSAGAIQTDESYLYGRFEVRMKSADGDGIVSSFFTYNTDWDSNIGNLNWNEIDIEMTGNRDSSVQFTTHHPGNPNSWSIGEIIDVDFNPHQEFHDYAIEWTPTSIKWFIDNEEVYDQGQSIVDDLNFSQKIMMNIWPAIWESWVGEWDEEDTPKHSYYDYVRYYNYSPGDGSYGTDNNFSFSWEDNFNYLDEQMWEDNSSGSFDGNICSFTPANTNIFHGHLILTLSDVNENMNCNEINGDIDYDTNLNVIDVVLMVDVILSNTLDSLEICQFLAVDSDCNQTLNVIDILMHIQEILNI